MTRNRLILLALLAAFLVPPPHHAVRAEDGTHVGDDDDFDHDHDRAQELLEQGDIQPLSEIIAHIAGDHPGEVVGVALSQSGGRWFYHFKILTPEGRLVALTVDAESMATVGTGEGG